MVDRILGKDDAGCSIHPWSTTIALYRTFCYGIRMKTFREYVKHWSTGNSGSRLLVESIMVPEVELALRDWIIADTGGILIGGCALSYYAKPRFTTGIDVMYLTNAAIPTAVAGFRRTRPHAFKHIKTHVKIELVTPDSINVSSKLMHQVVLHAETHHGVKMASLAGLIALKLQRLKKYDVGDIAALIEAAGGSADMTPFQFEPEEPARSCPDHQRQRMTSS